MQTKENIENELLCEAQICLYWINEMLTLASYAKEDNDHEEYKKSMDAVYDYLEGCSEALEALSKSQNYKPQ